MRKPRCAEIVFAVVLFFAAVVSLLEAAEIVIMSQNSHPTRESFQSKVWYAQESWWAWLPYGMSGGKMWRRGEDKVWEEQVHLEGTLLTLPGAGDVWAGEKIVVGATAEDSIMSVQGMIWSTNRGRYELAGFPLIWKEHTRVASISIDRDPSTGHFWVSYPLESEEDEGGASIIVRRLRTEGRWKIGPGIAIGGQVSETDRCAVTAVGDGLAVVWSDSRNGVLMFSRRVPGESDSLWSEPVQIASVEGEESPSFNICRPPGESGIELIVVSTTGAGDEGGSGLGFHRLDAGGQWSSIPFAPAGQDEMPANPVVIWVYGRPIVTYTAVGPEMMGFNVNRIRIQQFATDASGTFGEPIDAVPQVLGLDYTTAPKSPPELQPCILFNSDHEGRVVESVIQLAGGAGSGSSGN